MRAWYRYEELRDKYAYLRESQEATITCDASRTPNVTVRLGGADLTLSADCFTLHGLWVATTCTAKPARCPANQTGLRAGEETETQEVRDLRGPREIAGDWGRRSADLR